MKTMKMMCYCSAAAAVVVEAAEKLVTGAVVVAAAAAPAKLRGCLRWQWSRTGDE